jgi:hypothetical protein
MMELRLSELKNATPERRAELKRMAHYMRTGHLRPTPNLCKHGIDKHGDDVCWICELPTWARICPYPDCKAEGAEPLTLDGFLCHSCHRVYVIEGKLKLSV